MIVPSRSTKTAGDSSSVIVAVLSEAGDKFISSHGRCSKFANHDCASVVGDFCRFNWNCSADEPKSKERNRSIASARDIKDLARFCWNIMRLFLLLKKHHAVFPQRDADRRKLGLGLVGRWRGRLFAVVANDLLMTRNDARVDSCARRIVFNRIGEVDFLLR